MPQQRRSRVRLLAAERAELERRVAARTGSQQAAYRAQIILRAAAGRTDASIAPRTRPGRTHRVDVAASLRPAAPGRAPRSSEVSAAPPVRCRDPGQVAGAGLPEASRGRSVALGP